MNILFLEIHPSKRLHLKSASNNLDLSWTPPPFGQCPNRSRFFLGIASLIVWVTSHSGRERRGERISRQLSGGGRTEASSKEQGAVAVGRRSRQHLQFSDGHGYRRPDGSGAGGAVGGESRGEHLQPRQHV